ELLRDRPPGLRGRPRRGHGRAARGHAAGDAAGAAVPPVREGSDGFRREDRGALMKALAFVLLALAAASVDAPSVTPEAPGGGGELTAEAADGTTLPLALHRLWVEATVRGDAAETRVEHVFWNGAPRPPPRAGP